MPPFGGERVATSLVVDPFLVEVPPRGSGGIETWILALSSWLQEIEVNTAWWHHFLQSTAYLMEEGRFPTFTILRALSNSLGLDLNVAVLAGRINRFFLDPARDVLVSSRVVSAIAENLHIDPPDVTTRTVCGTILASELLCLACDVVIPNQQPREVSIVTRTRPLGSRITVRFSKAITDPSFDCEELLNGISTSFRTIVSPDEFYSTLNGGDLVQAGPDVFRAAVNAEAAKIPGLKSRSLTFGPLFWRSLDSSSIRESSNALSKLFRIVVHALCDSLIDQNVSLRPIRRTAAGNSPQRTRSSDGARAWRATISTHGVGWRLNFWSRGATESQPGIVELAIVQKKGDDPNSMPD